MSAYIILYRLPRLAIDPHKMQTPYAESQENEFNLLTKVQIILCEQLAYPFDQTISHKLDNAVVVYLSGASVSDKD
jgi:hypothetical protein